MKAIVDALVERYHVEWRARTSVAALGGDGGEAAVVTLPLYDTHNDAVDIVVVDAGGGVMTLSDDGYILQDLAASGCDMSTVRRQQILIQTLARFGVQLHQGEITTQATADTFARRLSAIGQAIVSAGHLVFTLQSNAVPVMQRDVAKWLSAHEIPFTPNLSIAGRSGAPFKFDFVIPEMGQDPEWLIKTISAPDWNAIRLAAIAGDELNGARPGRSRTVAFVNDEGKRLSPAMRRLLEGHHVSFYQWDRDQGPKDPFGVLRLSAGGQGFA